MELRRYHRRSGVIQHQKQIHRDEQQKHRVVSQRDKDDFDVTVFGPGGRGHQQSTQESSSLDGFIFHPRKAGEKMRAKKGVGGQNPGITERKTRTFHQYYINKSSCRNHK